MAGISRNPRNLNPVNEQRGNKSDSSRVRQTSYPLSSRTHRHTPTTPLPDSKGAGFGSTFQKGRLRSMSLTDKKASLQIDCLIVGGGIAGLACAYALSKCGHRVRVLEKCSGLHQRAAGVRVPPNMTKILHEWGLDKELSKAQKCRKSAFHSMETNEVIGYLEWQEDVIRETGGDFLLMHYDDIHTALYNLALSAGATVSFNTTITSVFVDEEKSIPSVTLADGSVLTADIIIGADGLTSVVREYVSGGPNVAVERGQTFFTIMVPSHKLKNDPDWAKWVNTPEWPIWMGDSRTLLGYPVHRDEQFCMHAYWPEASMRDSHTKETWDVPGSIDTIDLEGCHPSIKRLFSYASDGLRTKYYHREFPEDWVDESGRILLVGEAAHPFMPATIQNLALGIEDAAVLGGLLSRLRSFEQIPQLLYAFQDLREGRCDKVRESELKNCTLVTLSPGEQRDARDAGMRLSLNANTDGWDDERLRAQWEQIAEDFGYNAREAAEDWWVKWGSLGEVEPTVMLEVMKKVTES